MMKDGEESVASWELRVEGRLMEDVSDVGVWRHFCIIHSFAYVLFIVSKKFSSHKLSVYLMIH